MTGGSSRRTVESVVDQDGNERTCLTIGSPSLQPQRVIISLHGSGFDARSHDLLTDSDQNVRSGAVVLIPQAAIPFRLFPADPEGFAWNVPGTPLPGESCARAKPDDVAFILDVVEFASRRHPGLPIHLMGYSGGARLGSHIAGASTAVKSAALVAGVRFPSPPAHQPSVLAIHGKLDAINPYDGSQNERWGMSVRAAVAAWAHNADCQGSPQTKNLSVGVLEERFLHPGGDLLLRLVSLDAVGHAWPGTTDRSNVANFGNPGYWLASPYIAQFFSEVDSTLSRNSRAIRPPAQVVAGNPDQTLQMTIGTHADRERSRRPG